MAVGLKASVANSLLDALLKNTAYTGPATVYVQLHTASPGAAGTTAVAGNSTRKAVTWGTSASGSNSNSADIVWTVVGTAETYTHVSLWDALTSGNFLGDGTITASAITAPDTFTITTGSLTVTFSVAA